MEAQHQFVSGRAHRWIAPALRGCESDISALGLADHDSDKLGQGDVLPGNVAGTSASKFKQKEVRYFHIFKDDQIDETQRASWIRQAAELPGELHFLRSPSGRLRFPQLSVPIWQRHEIGQARLFAGCSKTHPCPV